MLEMEDVEAGARVTHSNTGLRYTVVDAGDEEVLLSPESSDLRIWSCPRGCSARSSCSRIATAPARGRARGGRPRGGRRWRCAMPSGPKVQGKIKKLVRERGFGFVRGDDGKEVFFHRSGLGPTDYALSEGDAVEYVVQEGPRGARAENCARSARGLLGTSCEPREAAGVGYGEWLAVPLFAILARTHFRWRRGSRTTCRAGCA
jgi:CspA family cold shock protein